MRRKIKSILGITGALAVLYCSVWFILLRINNIDMTDMRLLVEYPEYSVTAAISAALVMVSQTL